MQHEAVSSGFPLRLRINQFVNFLLITLLIRSGIQILADHPKLYWNVHCRFNSEWIKFTKKVIPKDRLWTAMDEAVDVSPWIGLSGGRHNLGMGRHWRFYVYGLVENPLKLSLDDLKTMPRRTQITMHNCIQGWSGIAEWAGLPIRELLDICQPLPNAGYVIFHSCGVDEEGREYYGSLDIEEASHPQTILAYEMNGAPLPIPYGAPLRLRVETKLGFKMVKYLRSIELVEDYRTVGLGHGGYREDYQYYGTVAGI